MRLIFLIVLLGIFSCQNNSTEQVKKETTTEKDEDDYWEQKYKKYKDIDTYMQWYCQEFPIVSRTGKSRGMIIAPSYVDTLSGNRVLLAVSHAHNRPNTLLFCIKDTKTKKIYSIFLLQGFHFYANDKPFDGGIKENFQSETSESKNKMKHVFFSSFMQIKPYQYDIQRLLERQAINDTLPPNTIDAFFDEIFLSIKNPKHKFKLKSFDREDRRELLFNKDTNLVSIKRFLNTKRARELPDYEKIKYMTMLNSNNNLLCYEIKKDTYILIFKSRKIHDIEIYVFGELINLNYKYGF